MKKKELVYKEDVLEALKYWKYIEAYEQIQKMPSVPQRENGMYECFHCLQQTVIWDADFDFSDFGLEGEGVVHTCHCTNCGARIQIFSGVADTVDNEDNIIKFWRDCCSL